MSSLGLGRMNTRTLFGLIWSFLWLCILQPTAGRVTKVIREREEGDELNTEDLKHLVAGLAEDVRKLSEVVETQDQILVRQEEKLEHVSDVSNKSLKLLKDLSGTGPGDCAELYHAGMRESGVYVIYPRHSPPVKAYCDMNHEGGGWTVFQRRYDGRVSFAKSWVEYARGFGKPEGEHWLGLRTIHKLTTPHQTELLVGLTDFQLGFRSESYSAFSVGSEDDKFRLRVRGHSGNAGDSLATHNGRPFSTKDRDNDALNRSCSQLSGGAGWWFEACLTSNLNGVYYRTMTSSSDAMTWFSIRFSYTSLKASIMMMRPASFRQENEISN